MSFKDRFGMSLPAMLAIVLGVFMAILDNTVVNVAIPKMMSVFNTTQSQIQWVITAYMLVIGMLTPVSGYLGDRFGQKRVYIFALLVFTIGSALCGLAWNSDVLITFRILQAIGGAMLMPTSMTILFSMAPPERRGAVMGIWGIALMFAPALGPTLSGYFVEYLDWRLIFYINVPVGFFSFLLVTATIPAMKGRHQERMDWPGFITSLIGFFSLLYALSDAPSDGWHSINVMSFLFVGLVSLALFVVVELTSDRPMLDLRLLARRVYLASLVSTSLLSISMFGVLFLLPIFLQNAIGLSPLQTGLLTLPGALITGVLMPISGFLFDRIGARPLGLLGLAIMAVTSYFFLGLNVDWAFGAIMLIYLFRQAGMGLSMMPISTAGMNDVPPSLISRATALQNTVRNVAGSIGTAYLSTVMQTSNASAFVQYSGRLSPHALQGLQIGHAPPSVFGITSGAALQDIVNYLRILAFQTGMQQALFVALVIGIIAWLSVFFIGKKKAPVGHAPGSGRHAAVAME